MSLRLQVEPPFRILDGALESAEAVWIPLYCANRLNVPRRVGLDACSESQDAELGREIRAVGVLPDLPDDPLLQLRCRPWTPFHPRPRFGRTNLIL